MYGGGGGVSNRDTMPSEMGGNSHLSFNNYDAVQAKDAPGQYSNNRLKESSNNSNNAPIAIESGKAPAQHNNSVKVNQDLRGI
jgi:hypothetical protein